MLLERSMGITLTLVPQLKMDKYEQSRLPLYLGGTRWSRAAPGWGAPSLLSVSLRSLLLTLTELLSPAPCEFFCERVYEPARLLRVFSRPV
jgi:hypothetical protein